MRLALRGRGALIPFAMALVFQGCATRTVAEPPAHEPTGTQATEVPIEPEPAPVCEPEPVAEEPSPVETVVVPETEFLASGDLYVRTFEELERQIQEWNAMISRKDYEGWIASLSVAYLAERGDATYLADVSRSRRLRDSGIVLRTLRDYFYAVVVPARVDAALEEIEFVGESKVKAYALVDGEHAILFYVVWEEGGWKIGTSSEMALDRSLG
jgi:hypothetical protein